VSTIIAIGNLEAIEMSCAKASSVIVLPNGALTMENEVDRPTVSTLKALGLNLAVLPHEVLHLLQDGVIAELRVREHCAL